jgi:hypothetical protein
MLRQISLPGGIDRPRTTAASLVSLLDSPVCVGVLFGAAAVVFVLLRFAGASHGNVASFILVGSLRAIPDRLPRGVPVTSGTGYDGQFYYRLALNPLNWSRQAFGIRLDSVARIERITYPFLAWALAAGQFGAIPVTLVVVNILALAILAGLCAALAREAGRDPMWGILVAAYWGFLWSLSRDLTEIVATMFVVAGLLAIRRRRPVYAALALSAAVLTRETALMVVGAVFLSRVVTILRQRRDRTSTSNTLGVSVYDEPPTAASGRSWIGPRDAVWAMPVVVFASWQAAVFERTGRLPLHASGSANVGAPFVGFAHGLTHYWHMFPQTASLLWFGELVILGAVAVMGAISLRASTAWAHERIAWFGYLLLTVSLASGIWTGDVGFRSIDDLFVFSCLLLLFSDRRLRVPALIVGAAWLAVAVELILFI